MEYTVSVISKFEFVTNTNTHQTISQLRNYIAERLKIDFRCIVICYMGRVLWENEIISGLIEQPSKKSPLFVAAITENCASIKRNQSCNQLHFYYQLDSQDKSNKKLNFVGRSLTPDQRRNDNYLNRLETHQSGAKTMTEIANKMSQDEAPMPRFARKTVISYTSKSPSTDPLPYPF